MSERQIAHSLGLSRPTVASYVHRAQVAGLSWPLPEGLNEAALEARLFPPPPARGTVAHLAPDCCGLIETDTFLRVVNS